MNKPSWFIIGFVLLLSACASNGSASFDITTSSDESGCVDGMFPFDPVFVAIRERGGGFGLFFQSEGGNFRDKDVLYVEVFDTEAAEAGDPLSFSVPGALNAEASGEIEVAGQCPDHTESYFLQGGSVVFDSFVIKARGSVQGSITDSNIVRFRDRVVVAEGLQGDFEMVLRRGPPYEEFISN